MSSEGRICFSLHSPFPINLSLNHLLQWVPTGLECVLFFFFSVQFWAACDRQGLPRWQMCRGLSADASYCRNWLLWSCSQCTHVEAPTRECRLASYHTAPQQQRVPKCDVSLWQQGLGLTSFSLQWERIQLRRVASYLLQAEMAMKSSQRPLRMGENSSGLLAEYASVPWDVLCAHCIALACFRMLSPLASRNVRPSHAACPAKPHHVLDLTLLSAHQGLMASALSSNPACWSPTFWAGKSWLACGMGRETATHYLEVTLPPQWGMGSSLGSHIGGVGMGCPSWNPWGPAVANGSFRRWDHIHRWRKVTFIGFWSQWEISSCWRAVLPMGFTWVWL